MKNPGITQPFRGPRGEPLATSIAEVGYHELGGVQQWVLIRGENISNPPLVVLHGGPGLSETALFRHYNAALEQQFTVVYWDQRGAGKSYDPQISRASMTIAQFVVDLDELVELVRARLHQPQVVILGHSWGSALGAIYAAKFPDKVAAYVGAAQVGDWAAGEVASHAYAVAEADRRGAHAIAKKVRGIPAPPQTAAQLFDERMCVARLEGKMRPRSLWQVASALIATPEASLLEMPAAWRAFRWTLEAMWPEVSRLNLIERVPALTMPTLFLLGRQDHWIPPEASVAYIEALRAPSKRIVWFEHSSHEMFVDEPEQFNTVMLEVVRPTIPSHPTTRAESTTVAGPAA